MAGPATWSAITPPRLKHTPQQKQHPDMNEKDEDDWAVMPTQKERKRIYRQGTRLASINKRNELPVPYSVLKHSLSREISHVWRAPATNNPSDSEPNGQVVVTLTSNTDDEIATVNDSDAD
ncbi:hypothetical protein SprV_0401405600 [Sparganum proliferum]